MLKKGNKLQGSSKRGLVILLLAFFLLVVFVVVINDRFTFSSDNESYQNVINSYKIRLSLAENRTKGIERQLIDSQALVKKLQIKLYESEKRIGMFGGDKNARPPRDGAFPNFIIMGTWKGGTTSLHKLFQNHPNMCLALGEVNFFSRPAMRNLGMGLYYKFFERCFSQKVLKRKDTSKELIIGEKSPTYLWNCKNICPKIKKVNPQVKLVVSLRNPIQRAYSNWYMDWCKGVFNDTFDRFIARTPKSLEAGIYLPQVKSLLAVFPKEQLHIMKTEEFFNDTRGSVARLESFLGVDHYNFTDNEIRVYGSSPKCQKQLGAKPAIDPSLLDKLHKYFAQANDDLEAFMKREFGWGPLGWNNN